MKQVHAPAKWRYLPLSKYPGFTAAGIWPGRVPHRTAVRTEAPGRLEVTCLLAALRYEGAALDARTAADKCKLWEAYSLA